MKTFAKLNILVICLAFAAFSCQRGEGFLAELASADTEFYTMEFTVQATDLDGFQTFQEESFSVNLNKILKVSGIRARCLNAVFKL
jgi:hypothetical protein